MNFGISPLTWTNDDMPSLGGNIPLNTCLSEMAQAGFTGTEMGTKYPRTPEELIPLLESKGLVLASGWFSGNLLQNSVEEEIESVQDHLSLLKAAGCKSMVIGEVSNSVHGNIDLPLSSRVILTAAEWQVYGDKLTRFADYMLEQGVRLAYHHHMGTVVETMADLETLFSVTGSSVGLTLDTAHIAYAGGNSLEILERFPERIAHVHVKDVRADVMRKALDEDWSFLNAVLAGVFTVPGDGCIDFPAFMVELNKIDYQGWILVEAEQDPDIYTPMTYASMAYKNLSKYAADAGLLETGLAS